MAASKVAPLSSRPQSTATSQMSTRVALYARVSTGNGQQDPEMQLRELREYAKRRDWQIAEVYTDTVLARRILDPRSVGL